MHPDTWPLVLIVEDNPTNLMLTSVVLKRARFRTVSARSAEDARVVLGQQQPDLILMDLQLPQMDGLTFTRQLKREAATANTPVVALTARAMRGDEVVAIEAGCDGYISKPIDVRTFAPFLREVLTRHAAPVAALSA
ncbi:MAG TPA: response regulator [Candidatus Dormibacteraeota bacterium]|jgi:CheY-like chemotaxis protein|nr:response regulator [Candidatus Dormibacteraeota bacterium]